MLYNLLAKILALLAKIIINKFNPKIIGVTGSVGKTSTKEAIYEVLAKSKKYQGKVEKAHGGLNTEIGLALAILGIKKPGYRFGWIWVILQAKFKTLKILITKQYPEILVLEYSVDKPGDMNYLTSIARPDIAVITQIGAAHLHTFHSIDNVAREKIELACQLKPDGIAVLNEDNKYIKKYSKKIFFDKIWYHGNSFDSVKNAAEKIAEIFQIDQKETNKILSNLKPVKGRLNIFRGIKNTTLIDDSYNANPLSMRRALKYLMKIGKRKTKFAILGDMRELGEMSKKEHQELAKVIANSVDKSILIGSDMQEYTAKKLKGLKQSFVSFQTFSEAKKTILNTIKGGEVILIKASQNTLFLERVTEMLLANKEDKKFLCRQSDMWQKIKKNTL